LEYVIDKNLLEIGKKGTATLHGTTDVHKGDLVINLMPSAKCKLVLKSHTNLAETLLFLIIAPEYCHMLPGPPGAMQRALRLYKSILRCSWKHLQLWRSTQDAMSFDL